MSLGVAQSDAAYQTPDKYVTKYGPMWGYRWAKERNVKVDGRLDRTAAVGPGLRQVDARFVPVAALLGIT